jgi:hypothetical protein
VTSTTTPTETIDVAEPKPATTLTVVAKTPGIAVGASMIIPGFGQLSASENSAFGSPASSSYPSGMASEAGSLAGHGNTTEEERPGVQIFRGFVSLAVRVAEPHRDWQLGSRPQPFLDLAEIR